MYNQQPEGTKSRPYQVFGLSYYGPFHNIGYGIRLVKMKTSDISALFVPALFPFQHKHRMADRGILKLLK
jgi:hypothetical protein